ncbi:outer membrane protein assembly factor BamB family protein [Actinoplanes derwentensis]|uniref:PQQ-like domain-containing protein n=1 Tax=Actinoplanes derwentensis TaxID=113562 RepID=A0A1H2BGU0_9ACTN|nr:PQQ-binding-like beta-propeller repeat protein [Actinoplanes derwentensis]GID87809.1 hypothetical protein Ade03nite_67330 [Actinoplanes derwentensis]SDT57465.1 hypothetical protein SAMN04489716_4606 [Actinoplanes derwentensis]
MFRRLTAVLLVLVLGGCHGPEPADLRGGGPLIERWRIPAPVTDWAFADPGRGLIGREQRLASVATGPGRLRWVHDLPSGFRVTASSVAVAGSAVLIRGTGRFRVLDLAEGTVRWEREFPGQAVAEEEGDALLTAECDRSGCDLAGWGLATGERRWARRVEERVELVTSGVQVCYCVFLLGRRTVAAIGTEDGRPLWTMRRPAGVTRLITALDRQILWTPPAAPGCVATLRGVDRGVVVWTRAIATFCGVPVPSIGDDPGGNLEIPVRGGLETLWSHDAGGRTVPLDVGEQLIEDGTDRITWTPGAGYRSIDSSDRTPATVAPPSVRRPSAEATPTGMWLLGSGSGLVLYDPVRRAVRWSGPAPALVPDHDRLVYVDGTDLVGIGPRS